VVRSLGPQGIKSGCFFEQRRSIPRSTLFALPQPESRRGAQLRQVSAVIPFSGGDREFESPILQRGVWANLIFGTEPGGTYGLLSIRSRPVPRMRSEGASCRIGQVGQVTEIGRGHKA